MELISELEKQIYTIISRNRTENGISAVTISKVLKTDSYNVRQTLTGSEIFGELCFTNSHGCYLPMICSTFPHYGLEHFCWYYSDVGSFLQESEESFLNKTEQKCRNTSQLIGRPLFQRNKIRMMRCSMLGMFKDIELRSKDQMNLPLAGLLEMEIAFNAKIQTSHGKIRIQSDVLLISKTNVYCFLFSNDNQISDRSIEKALELLNGSSLIFGQNFAVVPVIVSVKTSDQFQVRKNPAVSTGLSDAIPICSRNRLYQAVINIT